MQYIMTQLPFGYILRAVHHWTTHSWSPACSSTCAVYFTGAYRNPRELNWLIGVALMAPLGQPCLRCSHHGINLANSSPLIGKYIATLLFAGSELTPLTVLERISFTCSSYR